MLPRSDAGSNVDCLASIAFRLPKPSDLMLHVVPDVRELWATLLGRVLRFVQGHRTRNSAKERDPICAYTNGIAEHQFAGDCAS